MKITKRSVENHFWGYAMVAPTMIGLIILNIIPFIYTIYLSFTESDGFGTPEFVGLDNYLRLFNDPMVWQSVGNTLFFTILFVPMGVFLPLVIAELMNSKIKGSQVYKMVYFLPMTVAPAAIAMVWRWMYNTDYGIINFFVKFAGGKPVEWLINSDYTILSIAIVSIWSVLGYNLIILLAGLQGIPKTYYEAASIDGASKVMRFIHITVPMVSPVLFFVSITTLMGALQQFDLIYVMLGENNPAITKSQTILFLFYKYAYVINEKGYASSIVLLAFLMILTVTAAQFILQKKWVHYD